jgi:hypothetical protein
MVVEAHAPRFYGGIGGVVCAEDELRLGAVADAAHDKALDDSLKVNELSQVREVKGVSAVVHGQLALCLIVVKESVIPAGRRFASRRLPFHCSGGTWGIVCALSTNNLPLPISLIRECGYSGGWCRLTCHSALKKDPNWLKNSFGGTLNWKDIVSYPGTNPGGHSGISNESPAPGKDIVFGV